MPYPNATRLADLNALYTQHPNKL